MNGRGGMAGHRSPVARHRGVVIQPNVVSFWSRLGYRRARKNHTGVVEERGVESGSTHKAKGRVLRPPDRTGQLKGAAATGGSTVIRWPTAAKRLRAPARSSNYLPSTIRQPRHPLLLIMIIFATQSQPRVPPNHSHSVGHRD